MGGVRGAMIPDLNADQRQAQNVLERHHSLWLKNLISTKVLSKKDGKKLWEAVVTAVDENLITREPFPAFLKNLNEGLEVVDMTIRLGFNTATGHESLVLCNTMGVDEISKLSSIYTPNEITFFKKIVQAIMEGGEPITNHFMVSSMKVINLATSQTQQDQASQFSNFKKGDAEKALKKFVADYWLVSRDGKFGLGVRAVKELDYYLKELYPDVMLECHFCQEHIFTKFDYCEKEECTTQIHSYCSEKLFKGTQKSCPECKSADAWVEGKVLPAAASSSTTTASSSSTQRQRGRKSRSAPKEVVVEDDSEINEIESDDGNDNQEEQEAEQEASSDSEEEVTVASSSKSRPKRRRIIMD